jgi:hypothetical protein
MAWSLLRDAFVISRPIDPFDLDHENDGKGRGRQSRLV